MSRRHLLALLPLLFGVSARADEPVPSFQKHITPLFSRLGCNGGTCHGAVQGQNGFRLSLFAADPLGDGDRLLHGADGRRLNLHQPEASLLLLKATAAVPHQGGKRLSAGSPEHVLLSRWIGAGAPIDALEGNRIQALTVTPGRQTAQPGDTLRLKVMATFADGMQEDVTGLSSYDSLDRGVATVDANGSIRALDVGDTAIIVRYRAELAMALVMVPRPGAVEMPKIAPANFVDDHVLAKLRQLNLPPSALTDDAAFLRRANLDIAGSLPTPAEVRAFLADQDPAKRQKKIAELLQRPEHAALWAMKFGDLLKASDFGVYADAVIDEHDAPRFQAWMRARLQENVPYDQLVERVLTATSRDGRSLEEWGKEVEALFAGYTTPRQDLEVYSQRKTLDLYWMRKGANGVGGTLQVAHAFLGLRLECAQCHRHPHDVWQQDDLLSFANFFTRVRGVGFGGNNDKKFPEVAAFTKKLQDEGKQLGEEAKKRKTGKKLEGDELKQIQELERRGKNSTEVARRMMHAEIQHLAEPLWASVTSPIGTQKSERFRLLGQSAQVDVKADQDPRPLVVEWLRRPDNPYFARAIVNRVWAHYFGRGIIDPPDNLSAFNPASHPELLKELADRFIQNGYDLRWLHRTIAESRTYQQSSEPTEANRIDRANYAYFAYRRLPAEVLVDALNHATGTIENMDMKFQHWPDGIKCIEIPFTPKNEFVKFMLEQFGRPKRNSAVQCDCERESSVSILQVMSLANHPRLWQKIADPNGRVATVLKAQTDPSAQVEELFLWSLSRLPDDAEKKACLSYLKDAESPEKGLQGVLWSLLNTREFLLQH